MLKTKFYKLDNGLSIIMVPDKTKNLTCATIYMNFGGKYKYFKDENGIHEIIDGTAHLLEHTLIEASVNGNNGEYFLSKDVEYNGATSLYKTWYYIKTLDNFKKYFTILLDEVNMRNFDQKKLDIIKKPIYSEIEKDNDRRGKLIMDTINEITFNYKAKSIVGTKEEIKDIKEDYLKYIYDTFYIPKNETIVISGNFDEKEVLKLIKDKFKKYHKENKKYEILDPKTDTKIFQKKKIVHDKEDDEYIINFKVDVSSFDDFSKLKLDYYFGFLYSYHFSNSSKLDKYILENNISIHHFSFYKTLMDKDIYYLQISLRTGKNIVKLVLNELKNYDIPKDEFKIIQNNTILELINRMEEHDLIADSFYSNYSDFGLEFDDNPDFISKLNLKEYNDFMKKLDFSHYSVVINEEK